MELPFDPYFQMVVEPVSLTLWIIGMGIKFFHHKYYRIGKCDCIFQKWL